MDEEGSPMGPLLRAVNRVADAISEEFPNVVVDTLAYQVSPHSVYVKLKPDYFCTL